MPRSSRIRLVSSTGWMSTRIGRFYERRGHPTSAVYYYRHCIAAYPGTGSAAQAQERLDALGGGKKAS